MAGFQVAALLKRDQLGRVERIDRLAEGSARPFCVRRVAAGGALPLSGWLARRLAARERRALEQLRGLEDVPQPCAEPEAAQAASLDGRIPRAKEVLLRSWIEGQPLHRATRLPADFFDQLDELVHALHARGVCHNDLHKEQNVLVDPEGRPKLVDFQLASCHARRGRLFASRAREDLRHVEKHRRRYTRLGRGPQGGPEPSSGAGSGLPRSFVARTWRRLGKPLYLFVTRSLLRTRDGEERRPSSGPWPLWTEPIGRRSQSTSSR